MNKDDITVLTPEKIKQKVAGFKANYTRLINSTKNDDVRKTLEDEREAKINGFREKLEKENRHNRQVRAGIMSWETRRENSKKRKVTSTSTTPTKTAQPKTPTTPKKQKGSKVGIHVVNKH